ncbi:lysis system i-spanin subunit Rz [Pseudomonas chlororaphis]|uniref:lysis system i-spanin subunit Rz n=1 Tax=Pseudomonas chlororaphis TaxID=587753 RepID=UPI001389E6D2|nr:lysis system i-spanin subunit Rz [Pseudomonas chlororaphis]
MRLIELIPAQIRLLVAGLALVALLGGVAVVVWTVQDWRYGGQLEQQARLQAESLNQVTLAAAARQREEQDKRLALEQQLQASDQTHYRALSDAQRDQGRLRDRLATADLRLSVLLDASDSSSGCAVPATTTAGGVVYGVARARLDPAHAQRIIGITNDGDQGLIALAACQAYARKVSTQK